MTDHHLCHRAARSSLLRARVTRFPAGSQSHLLLREEEC
ncbi:hypothetical protein KOPIIPEJ_02603 [Aeromonas dhakensis]